MTTNAERREILERALHAAVQGDDAALTAIYTADVKAWTPAHSTASREELLAELQRTDDAFSEFEIQVAPLDVGGRLAGAEWRVSMTHTGDLALRDAAVLPPTGLRITINGVTIAEFEGDRICALRQYWDEQAILEQLGVVSRND